MTAPAATTAGDKIAMAAPVVTGGADDAVRAPEQVRKGGGGAEAGEREG